MSGLPVVGRYVTRSWSSGSGAGTERRQASPSPRQPRSTWRLPAFFRRRLEIAQRGGGRVGSTGPGDSEGGVAVTEEAFKDTKDPQHTLKDPRKDPMRESTSTDPIKDFEATPSPYDEPEIHDVGVREPRYLDLFDPGVSVVRDPKLDLPPAQPKSRARSLLAACLASLASTRVVVCCSVVLVVLVVVIVALASTSRHAFPQDPRIQPPYVTTVTTCGFVQGMVDGGAFVFRGVPYAVPPVGERRFRRSQPHSKLEDCWTGTYLANVTRPCWGYDSQGGVVQGFEDCLLLDVFTPQLGYDTPLPVVVVVGGASLGGDAQRPWMVSKAAQLVQDRHVVVVSPQLRRGPFGFFPHPAVAAATYPHTAGNQGASDLLAALTWTRHNVEHFGGDPTQVTLLGHRAGAALAWPLLSSRSGRDLVHSAWLSGAAPHHPTLSWRDADPALVESLNCTSVACLEAVPARQVMEAPPLEWRRPGHHAWLVADGLDVSFLPAMPQVPLVLGSTEQVAAEPLLSWRGRLGTSRSLLLDAILEGLRYFSTAQEQPTTVQPSKAAVVTGYGKRGWPPPLSRNTEEEVQVALVSTAAAEAALERYSEEVTDPWLLLTTLVSDATTTCPALAAAASMARSLAHRRRTPITATPVYAYLAHHARAARTGTLADGTTDLEALLGLLPLHSAADRSFAHSLQELFFRFVADGVPERHDPTPAQLGVYLVGNGFTVQRSRPLCDHWANASHLAGRF
ncbi:neurotactin-like [Portunus trituberculatus]|uniref:neurotactin-like n=1 Tax=Portunus trituberculatus TaxID=210409 RepID=UPI001E1CD3A6|nr:neurotactin-like [Portunus trituberculatus]